MNDDFYIIHNAITHTDESAHRGSLLDVCAIAQRRADADQQARDIFQDDVLMASVLPRKRVQS